MSWMKKGMIVLALVVLMGTTASANISITIGKGDFYVSVGDYDYLPYGTDRLPRISFYDMMTDYGTWVTVSPFGRAWRPYVYYDWQPYTYGHWIYTRYGPTWVGYEPWAWAAYHYGNWIWSQNYGWVWIPGYDWHPGRVIWSHSYNTIGWMPAPPYGHNYLCGYLCPERRYTSGYGYEDVSPRYGGYEDDFEFEEYDDFDEYEDYDDFDNDDYYEDDDDSRYRRRDDYRYGQNYRDYDPYAYGFRYDPYLYSSAYLRVAPRLWVFIPSTMFANEDYSDFYFEPDYIRYLFDRRIVQINRSPLDRFALEQLVRQRITEQPVQITRLETERRQVMVVVPIAETERIRKHATRVVKEVIAPSFVEKRKPLKGRNARNRDAVARVFRNDREQQVETLDSQRVVKEAQQARERRKEKRQRLVKKEMEVLKNAEREGKLDRVHKAREQAERREQRKKMKDSDRTRSRTQRERDSRATTQRDRRDRTIDTFRKWEKRETAKFEAWKKQQSEKLEMWKKRNNDKPQDVKTRVQSRFQQRMNEAEKQFEARKKRAQERFENDRGEEQSRNPGLR